MTGCRQTPSIAEGLRIQASSHASYGASSAREHRSIPRACDAACRSSGDKWLVALQLPGYHARYQPRLHFQDTPVTDGVTKQWMRDELLHPPLIPLDDPPPRLIFEGPDRPPPDKVAGTNHVVVDHREHGRIANQRSKLLGEVERQRGSTIMDLMKETDVRIEARRDRGRHAVLEQQGVQERQQRVDRVLRRTAVALLKVKGEVRPQHSLKLREVDTGRRALNAQEALHRFHPARAPGQPRQFVHRRLRRTTMVPAQQRALVSDLAPDECLGQRKCLFSVSGETILCHPKQHVALVGAGRHRCEPSAVRKVQEQSAPRDQAANRLRAHLHIADQCHVRNIDEPNVRFGLIPRADVQALTLLPHRGALTDHVKRARLIARRDETANLLGLDSAQEIHLIGQANAHERTAGALRAVYQRRRRYRLSRRLTESPQGLQRLGDQHVVELYGKALLGRSIVNIAVVASVAVLPEDERLHTELHEVRFPGSLAARRPFLVVHGDHAPPFSFEKVYARDQSEIWSRQQHASGRDPILRFQLRRLRQWPALPVHPPVNDGSLERVDAMREFSLYPLEIEQAGAVDELVDHPGRNEFR